MRPLISPGCATGAALNRRQFIGSTIALAGAPLMAQVPLEGGPDVFRHVVAWRESGRYGGWPANHGVWNWGDEIVCGCTAGYMKTGDPNRHPIDRRAGEAHALLRSMDGGLSWAFEAPAALVPPPRPERIAVTGETPVVRSAAPLVSPIDFTAPDLALTFRRSHDRPGRGCSSRRTGRAHGPARGTCRHSTCRPTIRAPTISWSARANCSCS